MIEVTGTMKAGKHELLRVRITNLTEQIHSEYADYSIEFVVDTGEGFAAYQRSVYAFPRKKYNALGLLKLALDSLDEKELTLDADPDARRSPDLARRLPRSV